MLLERRRRRRQPPLWLPCCLSLLPSSLEQPLPMETVAARSESPFHPSCLSASQCHPCLFPPGSAAKAIREQAPARHSPTTTWLSHPGCATQCFASSCIPRALSCFILQQNHPLQLQHKLRLPEAYGFWRSSLVSAGRREGLEAESEELRMSTLPLCWKWLYEPTSHT